MSKSFKMTTAYQFRNTYENGVSVNLCADTDILHAIPAEGNKDVLGWLKTRKRRRLKT